MPLILLTRLLLSLVSLAILAAGGYLLWSWWDGAWITGPDGPRHIREDWRLIAALASLAWSFLGRFVVLAIVARPAPRRGAETDGSATASDTSFVTPGGSRLWLTETGPRTAPTVLLTHGWGLDQTIWRGFAGRLAGRYRVLTWDLPGLGRSRPPKGAGIDLDLFARDLAAIVDGVEGPVVLVGHSIGGMTIQTLIRDGALADKVSGIVLVNTTYTNPVKTMILARLAQALRWPVLEPCLWLTALTGPIAQLMAWQSYLSGSAHLAMRLGFAGEVTRAQLERSTLITVRNSQSVSARGNLAMFRWDATGALARTSAPILVLAGARDILTKPDASRVLASSAPRAELVVIPNANHMGFLEREDAYATAVEAFCARSFGGTDRS